MDEAKEVCIFFSSLDQVSTNVHVHANRSPGAKLAIHKRNPREEMKDQTFTTRNGIYGTSRTKTYFHLPLLVQKIAWTLGVLSSSRC